MPYIKKEIRIALDAQIAFLNQALHEQGDKKGNLNYSITMLLKNYLDVKGISYDTISDITGVMNDALTEFERGVVGPYEDKKIAENGKIYE